MIKKMFIFVVLLSFALILLVENKNFDSMARIVNRNDLKQPIESSISSGQTGEVLYEDESEFQSDEDFNDHQPYYPPIKHIPYEEDSYAFNPMSKRYGHSIFGDDFALFLVLLTIAGFFGLIISMLMPFAFIMSNGGVLPLGVGGINGVGGLGGIGGFGGIGGLGGLGGLGGFNGINGGIIGRKKRSEVGFKKKIPRLLSLLDLAIDKYSTYI